MATIYRHIRVVCLDRQFYMPGKKKNGRKNKAGLVAQCLCVLS